MDKRTTWLHSPPRLIPEYEILLISGLRRSKVIQESYKKVNGTPKVFGIFALFESVSMSDTK